MIVEARSPPVPKDAAPGRDHLSFSAINLYRGCSLRYFFHHVLGLPEHVVSSSLLFGSGVHQSLDVHFRELLHGHPPPSLDMLLDVFWESWRNLDGVEVRFNKGEDLTEMGRLAERVLRAFQVSELADPKGNIIAIEESLRGELIPGVPDLVARVDLIVETEEAVCITDFKTSRGAWGQDHVEDAGGQLLLYHELVKPLAGDKPIRLQFMVMTKSKMPDIAMHAVEVDGQKIERTKKIVERVWRAIESGAFYPSPSALNCPTCPYRGPCRAWTG